LNVTGTAPEEAVGAAPIEGGTMKTTLREPTARLLDLLSRRLKRRRKGSHDNPKGFTLHADRGRGSFLRNRTAEDRSDLGD
jgi:hypothetical protein